MLVLGGGASSNGTSVARTILEIGVLCSCLISFPFPLMPSLLTTSFLSGFTLLAVSEVDDVLYVDAQLAASGQPCPCCGDDSARVHSRYVRHIRDLPVLDRPLRVRLRVRRFFCDNDGCPRRTFAEGRPCSSPSVFGAPSA